MCKIDHQAFPYCIKPASHKQFDLSAVVYDPSCFGVITTRHDSCFGHDIKNTMNIEEHYIGDFSPPGKCDRMNDMH